MDQEEDRRTYHSPLRDSRAATTRRLILAAARRLISERGFGATTMRDIATEAGVAVQTIYSSIGSKREILSAFIDQMEDDAKVEDAVAMFQEAGTPREQLRTRAYWSRRIYGVGIEMIEMMIHSQGTSPEIQDLLEEGDHRHRSSIERFILDGWSDDVIRDDLTRDEALDIISILSGVEVYRLLVRRCGWPPNRYEEWVYESLVEQVLSDRYRT